MSLEPTAEGAALYRRIERDILAEERRLLADFEPETRQALIRLIARLADAAAARLVSRGGKCCSIGR